MPFPDPAFRNFVLILLGGDIGLSFLWDRLMTFIFAPQVLWASVKVKSKATQHPFKRPLEIRVTGPWSLTAALFS